MVSSRTFWAAFPIHHLLLPLPVHLKYRHSASKPATVILNVVQHLVFALGGVTWEYKKGGDKDDSRSAIVTRG